MKGTTVLQEFHASAYGFKDKEFCVVYFKNNKWRIYEQSCYSFRDFKKLSDKNRLIEEVMMEKRVKRENVRLAQVKVLIAEYIEQ